MAAQPQSPARQHPTSHADSAIPAGWQRHVLGAGNNDAASRDLGVTAAAAPPAAYDAVNNAFNDDLERGTWGARSASSRRRTAASRRPSALGGSSSRKRYASRTDANWPRWALLVIIMYAVYRFQSRSSNARQQTNANTQPPTKSSSLLAIALNAEEATDTQLADVTRDTLLMAKQVAKEAKELADVAARKNGADSGRPDSVSAATRATTLWRPPKKDPQLVQQLMKNPTPTTTRTPTTTTTRAPREWRSQPSQRRWSRDPRGEMPNDADAETRRQAVKDAMSHAWRGYETYAFGFDELMPLSRKGKNMFAGTGATIIDSLDTLWLMGLTKEFEKARDWVATSLKFDYAGDTSVFETTIRVLGGLMSAYDLAGDSMFLEKAADLADKMKAAFETPTGIPRNMINFKTGKARAPPWVRGQSVLAEFGTEQLEWIALSDRTGDPSYAELVRRSMSTVVDTAIQNSIGLVPLYIDPNTGKFGQPHISFGAMGDSFYEYLLKMFVQGGLDGSDRKFYEYWIITMDQMIDRLTRKTTPSGWWYVDEWRGHLMKKMDHLVCFVPGMLALSLITIPEGLDDALDSRRARYLEAAENIAEFCYRMYDRQPTGLAPEYVKIVDGQDFIPGVPVNLLRPETVESMMLLWRLTKKQRYRDWGWAIFMAFERHCRADVGYSGVKDVRRVPPQKDDTMQSFFLAETLKYLYLLFSPDDVVPLDEWVFNTEAHPIRIHRPDSRGQDDDRRRRQQA
ncbi:mannosyl-oligosaccharide alpha-1,2-mannosidase [Pycnococcus provasolii]